MESDVIAVPSDGLTTKDRHRNRFMFGLGTLGRDMVYTLVSMYLMFYLTDIFQVTNTELIAITVIMIVLRVFDALNDPIMGTVVDNTRTKWGKYKPWMTFGMFAAGSVAILLFTDFGIRGAGFIALFAVLYFFWGIFFTTNDTSYWGMMPSLTDDQKEREKIGSIARICANIGLFSVVALITPITTALGNLLGSATAGYTLYAGILVGIMWLMQLFTLIWVKEPKLTTVQPRTGLGDMFRALFKNDQLLVIAISMALFMIGYCTTTSFGQYYFKYVYGDEGMYSVFAVILGVSQITALVVFPFLTKKFNRKTLFIAGVVGVAVGYITFFFMPANYDRHRRIGRVHFYRSGVYSTSNACVPCRHRRIRRVQTWAAQRKSVVLRAVVYKQARRRGRIGYRGYDYRAHGNKRSNVPGGRSGKRVVGA